MPEHGAAPGRFATALQAAWWHTPPTPLARALQPLALLYRLLAALHRATRWPQRVDVPVIVVGNLVAGGAGKTPTVIALVRLLRAFGWTPGVVSRGYGRTAQVLTAVHPAIDVRECGDEPLLIHLRTQAPVMVHRDRVAAARELRRREPLVDVIVCDDGLQHHRLARDAEVIVVDERGVGNGLLLPAGPLRQPVPLALPPHSLLLYNGVDPLLPLPGWTARRRLPGVLTLEDWRCGHAPLADSWAHLQGRRVLAAAGIAAPQRFFDALREQGLDVQPLPLPDHHDYAALPWPEDTPEVVVTEKDAVKLQPTRLGRTQVWVAPLDLEPDLGFAAAIKRLFPHPLPP